MSDVQDKMTIRKSLQNLKLISSSDVDIIASEHKTRELFNEAATTGKAPGNSCKIQILGDERAGKTSLRKKLMGERFDPNEPSTFGIDTRMCNVNEIDGSWRERKHETVSEYDQIMSWVLADRLHKWRCKSTGEYTAKTRLTRNLLNAVIAAVSLLFIAGVILLSVVLSSIVTALTFCYGLVLISATSVVITRKSDVYRVGVGIAIAIPMVDVLFGCLFVQTKDGLEQMSYRVLIMTMTWLLSATLHGFVCGFGLRSGVAAALLLLTHPTSVAGSTPWQDSTPILEVIKVLIGMSFGMAFTLSSRSIRILPILQTKIIWAKIIWAKIIWAKIIWAKIPNWLTNLGIQPVLLSILITVVIKYVTVVPNYIYGVLLGFGIISGILLGRWLAACLVDKKSYVLFPPNFMILNGFLVGISSGYMCGYRIPFLHEDGHGIFGALTRISPLVVIEIYRRLVNQTNPAPVRMVSAQLSKSANTVPIKLSLWDFAGQEFYYNTHHTFLASDAVYLIVFDLLKFKQDTLRYFELERIKYWMTSIYQHADSPIILVGTHLDSVDQNDVMAAHKHFDVELFSHDYPYVRKLVFNGISPFFAIDNTGTLIDSSDTKDHTEILRQTIRQETEKARPMKREYPIRWRRFLDLLHRKQITWPSSSATMATMYPDDPFISLSELKKIIGEFGMSDAKDINEMLQFFHDSGEILYDSVDSILRQFVVLQPQLLVDVMQSIAAVAVTESSGINGPLSRLVKRLESRGLLEYKLAELLIKQTLPTISDTNLDITLGMLEAKDLICRVKRGLQSGDNSDVYIVPSMLPVGKPLPPIGIEWNVCYYIDFASILPDAVLFRLMARCALHSDLVDQGSYQCALFRKGGIFTLGTQFFFMLRKVQPCPYQHVVEVAVKAVPESNPIDVLRYISDILETLRCRDFPRLWYHVGIRCPHSAPHQGCVTEEAWHIIRLCGNGDTSFPEEPSIHRLCNGRQIDVRIDEPIPACDENTDGEPIVVNIHGDNNFVIAAARNARVSVHRTVIGAMTDSFGSQDTVHDKETIDVYISSSPRDEGWVQENLVRILSGPPHDLTVCVNRYDTPSQPKHILNVKQIAGSHVFVVVCSKQYARDLTGRLTYEREVARRRRIPLIAVQKDNTSKPGDMFDSEGVAFSKDDNASLDLLLMKIQTILNMST